MDRQFYIEQLLDHYQNPRNKGPLPDADVIMGGGNPGCGDVVTIYLKVDGEGRVERVTFEGEGCTISQAGASMVTEMMEGKPLAEIQAMGFDPIIDAMGREVVMTRFRCATLGIGVLKGAVDAYLRGERGGEPAPLPSTINQQ